MKKTLLLSLPLIAAGSMAAAEISMSGYGRFGLDYDDSNDRTVNGVSETNITSRLRLQFDMSTETDGGVTFGARYRLQADSNDNAPAGGAFNGARFYARAGGFELGVGNINGALDSMPGLYLPTLSEDTGIDGMGDNALVLLNGVDSYSSGGAGANGIEVIYEAGNFAGHFSYSTDNGAVAADRIAAHIAYSFGDWTVALGIQDSDTLGEDVVAASVEGKIGNFGVGLAYAQNADNAGAGNDVDKVRLYGSADIGTASTVVAWVANEDNPFVPARDGASYGINYEYDLGGGVTFIAGAAETATDQTQVQAGVWFRF